VAKTPFEDEFLPDNSLGWALGILVALVVVNVIAIWLVSIF
jgi:hypothetical protein